MGVTYMIALVNKWQFSEFLPRPFFLFDACQSPSKIMITVHYSHSGKFCLNLTQQLKKISQDHMTLIYENIFFSLGQYYCKVLLKEKQMYMVNAVHNSWIHISC